MLSAPFDALVRSDNGRCLRVGQKDVEFCFLVERDFSTPDMSPRAHLQSAYLREGEVTRTRVELDNLEDMFDLESLVYEAEQTYLEMGD